jgi:hypothetical protein
LSAPRDDFVSNNYLRGDREIGGIDCNCSPRYIAPNGLAIVALMIGA